MLSKFKDLFAALLPKTDPAEKELEEIKGEDIRPSQEPPKPYGLKNKVIFAILGIVVVIFLTSIIFGMIAGTKPKMPEQNNPVVTKPVNPAASQPNSYEDMAKQIAAAPKASEQKTQQQQPKQATPPQITPTENYVQQGNHAASTRTNEDEWLKSPIGVKVAGQNYGNSQVANTGKNADNNNLAQQKGDNGILNISYRAACAFQIHAGTIIPAVLITGINSDLKGQVVAQVRQNIFDSQSGEHLLIPQGTRLLGVYGGDEVGTGQKRIGVAWTRMILPNGSSIDLGEMVSLDRAGYPGLKDKVDNHSRELYRAAFMSSLFAGAAMMAAGGNNSDDRSPGQEAVAGAAANILNIGTKLAEKQMSISPTITIRPGMAFDVFVGKDIVGLKPYM